MRDANRTGFTLIEIIVVTALIAGVMAIAVPQLLPVIAVSTHDGAARHLAAYTRGALHYAASADREVILIVDLDDQAYWCEGWPEEAASEDEETDSDSGQRSRDPEDESDDLPTIASEFEGDPFGKFLNEGRMVDPDTGRELLNPAEDGGGGTADLRSREYWYELSLRVPHNPESAYVLDQQDIEREQNIRYDEFGNPIERQIVRDPLLSRVKLPDDLAITAVHVGNERFSEGRVEIPVTPFGLEADAQFTIENARGEAIAVRWEAVFGRAEVVRGDRLHD